MTLTLTPRLMWNRSSGILRRKDYMAEIHTVSYELQREGNQMLSIKKHPNQ
jgi:hypothetical protein